MSHSEEFWRITNPNLCLTGRGDWIRTSGPLHPMQVRYQAAPLPDQLQDSTAMVVVQDSGMPDMLFQNRKKKSK